ncbi:MAG: aminoacyl-tRNA hydrolase [Syntrophomonadaceae bacterium]|nr:aminoacyl-tRNA hydrolase [Syntrophomonadaceae bacterium]
MKVIVGLGNPGKKYSDTRHNIGFRVLEEVARRHGVQKEESRFDALIAHIMLGGQKVLLVKPLTYMNLSGKAVQPLLHWYKADLSDLIVVYDDMDLPVGNLRLRADGGSGGHKGLTSVIERLGSREFNRLRLGIGRPTDEAIDWVLGTFAADEKELVKEMVAGAADRLEYWVEQGIVRAMNEYN